MSTIQYHAENQIDTLVEEGVDGLLFETYYDLEELTNIVTTTRRKYDIPIIAQLTASNTNYLVDGTEINKALQQLVACGANVVGLNCHHGPHHMQRSFSHIELPKRLTYHAIQTQVYWILRIANLSIAIMHNISEMSHKNLLMRV